MQTLNPTMNCFIITYLHVCQSATLIRLFLCAIDLHHCPKVIKNTSTGHTVPPNALNCHISCRGLKKAKESVSCACTAFPHKISSFPAQTCQHY